MRTDDSEERIRDWILEGLKDIGLDYFRVQSYGEKGYSTDKPIILANWNALNKKECSLVEEYFEIEWSDEWEEDDEGRIFRSSPDSAFWQRAFFWVGTEIVPWDRFDLTPDNLREYGFVFSAGSVPRRSLFLDFIDVNALSEFAEKHVDNLESGLHPGQDASLEEETKKLGEGEFVVAVGESRQFDMDWSIWKLKDKSY